MHEAEHALAGHLLAAAAIAVLLALLHRRQGLAPLVMGADERLSTSKTTVFAWTIAILYALLSLLIAKALGHNDGWDTLTGHGLQEEYLVLLGGPYAAAIIAKVSAVSQATTAGKPPGGGGGLGQLISDDSGDTDLGDLQYILFNGVALVYFLVDFWSAPENGFPDLPSLLAGLVLTSAGGYAAKKLIGQSAPTLTSVVPPVAAAGATVHLYGANLIVPASVTPDKRAWPPIVTIGGLPVVIAEEQPILGADRLTLVLPDGLAPGSALVNVVRADGIPATGPAGADGIPITVS